MSVLWLCGMCCAVIEVNARHTPVQCAMVTHAKQLPHLFNVMLANTVMLRGKGLPQMEVESNQQFVAD